MSFLKEKIKKLDFQSGYLKSKKGVGGVERTSVLGRRTSST
jgi:hypothetical protein